MNRIILFVLAGLLGALALVGCGDQSGYDDQSNYVEQSTPVLYAQEVCEDARGYRVPMGTRGCYPVYLSGYTPIYVPGYNSRLDTSWSRTRPNVTNITINNSSSGGTVTPPPAVRTRVPVSQAPVPAATNAPARVPAATRAASSGGSSSITRGGLGAGGGTGAKVLIPKNPGGGKNQ